MPSWDEVTVNDIGSWLLTKKPEKVELRERGMGPLPEVRLLHGDPT